MAKASRGFQVFVKPVGALCNLGCSYCYYLDKERLYPEGETFKMADETLESYIAQHIEASPEEVISFSWHGGEPTLLGLDFYSRVVELQRRHKPPGRSIFNGVQTNGALLDEEWCRFFAEEGFAVGLSMDGPPELHDLHRVAKDGKPTHWMTMRGYRLLRKHGVPTEILCVVNAQNVRSPLRVYRFFKQIDARYITFLPLVEPDGSGGVTRDSVPAEEWGEFLCTVFDEWRDHDVGRVKVQIFEEAARTAFNQEHSLCIFRPPAAMSPSSNTTETSTRATTTLMMSTASGTSMRRLWSSCWRARCSGRSAEPSWRPCRASAWSAASRPCATEGAPGTSSPLRLTENRG